ncbi:hypothetical protein ABZ646_47060, partial [Streptomyces sp. NPDC007162]
MRASLNSGLYTASRMAFSLGQRGDAPRLSEARDVKGAFYDPADRLRGRLFPGPEELLSALTDDVRLHTGGRSTDDLALLAVA